MAAPTVAHSRFDGKKKTKRKKKRFGKEKKFGKKKKFIKKKKIGKKNKFGKKTASHENKPTQSKNANSTNHYFCSTALNPPNAIL